MQTERCPRCGSNNLDYESHRYVDGNQISYPFTCEDCGFIGKEWYSLRFTGYTDEHGTDITSKHGFFMCWNCDQVYAKNLSGMDELYYWFCPLCKSKTSGTNGNRDAKTKALITMPPMREYP